MSQDLTQATYQPPPEDPKEVRDVLKDLEGLANETLEVDAQNESGVRR